MDFFNALLILFCSWLVFDVHCTEIPPKAALLSKSGRSLTVYGRKHAGDKLRKAFDARILRDYKIRKKICSIEKGLEYGIMDDAALKAVGHYEGSGYFGISFGVEQEHAEDLFELLVHQREIHI